MRARAQQYTLKLHATNPYRKTI